ncbi:TetR family transcriptional regulator [Paenibacillus sp. MWE-103]|uniref:TetR family transcriptional regulator n=1 Tax=Paenibacillus artemisiicola TaxID=1172618 RepID=A0ABS3WDA4_9BACL|nr:TetR family transcriptional regulator [Paenibacillus artemisiicola]MBO7746283.1 TetR family transcriptional regulator [Paenibacillus artemisiicola]
MQPQEEKPDPRVLRTRQLILDAFRSLIQTKDLKDITVGDITERATINRATFYAHYADKYELMDATLTTMFWEGIQGKLQCHAEFSRSSLASIVVTVCEFHRDLSTHCLKNYEATGPLLEKKVKALLQEVLFQLMRQRDARRPAGFDEATACAVSTMLAWSIYGLAYAWNADGRRVPPAELAETSLTALAHVVAGIVMAEHPAV